MKITKQTKIELDFEEYNILEKAEDILSRICDSFDSNADCPTCPMYGMCQQLGGAFIPQAVLQYAIDHLYIEE